MAVTGAVAQYMDALFARCGSIDTGSPALPIAYPEIAFTPPGDNKYLKVDFFANAPAWEGMSSGSLAQGLLQITVVWPHGVGIIAPAQIAQNVIDTFTKGLTLFSGTSRITVSKVPYAASPIMDDVTCRIPVIIAWTGADNS